MDSATRNKVLQKMTTERDLRNQMAYAREEAIREGRAEGRAEGRTELLKNLLESGLPIEEVSRLTKIDIQEIERLTGVNQ